MTRWNDYIKHPKVICSSSSSVALFSLKCERTKSVTLYINSNNSEAHLLLLLLPFNSNGSSICHSYQSHSEHQSRLINRCTIKCTRATGFSFLKQISPLASEWGRDLISGGPKVEILSTDRWWRVIRQLGADPNGPTFQYLCIYKLSRSYTADTHPERA